MRRYYFFQITQTQAHVTVRLPKAAKQTNSILKYTSPNLCMAEAKSMTKSESEPGKYSEMIIL